MTDSNPVLEAVNGQTSEQYRALETLYHQQPDEFQQWLTAALEVLPTSDVLLTWQARLQWRAAPVTTPMKSGAPSASWSWVVILGLLAAVLAKLPSLFPIEADWYYPRFVALLPVLPMIAYGLLFPVLEGVTRPDRVFLLRFGVPLALLVVYLGLLPDQESDSILMAMIHVGPLMLALLTFSLMQQRWKDTAARLSVLRLLGETLVLAVLVLLGGMVMTGLTLGLFYAIGLGLSNWYMEYVVVSGLVAAPMVGLYVFDHFLERRARLAAMLARVFAPLFLITIVAYLAAMLTKGTNPYTDRDFLILMNGILLVIWGITVFSIVGRKDREFSASDGINLLLIIATLVIDLIALFAISQRWWDQGITPNRVAVAGANLVIFVHLNLILRAYLRLAKNTGSQVALEYSVARYLPVYSAWSAFVVLFLPLLFWFA